MIIIICSPGVKAQDIKIKCCEKQLEPMIVEMQRFDHNNQVCGLIKIAYPQAGVSFKGNVISAERAGSEYWVYVSPGTKYLQIHIPDFMPYMLNFNDWDIDYIKSKSIYYVHLEPLEREQSQTNPLISECVSLYNEKEYGKAKNLALTYMEDASLDSKVAARLNFIAKRCDSIVSNIDRLNRCAKTLNELKAEPIIVSPECFLYLNKEGKLWGLCDVEGNSLISPIFSRIEPTDKDRFIVLNNDRWSIVDAKRLTITDLPGIHVCWPVLIEKEYDKQRGVVVKSSNNHYGLMDRRTGEMIIPAPYDGINKSSDVYIAYNHADSKVFIYDEENDISKRMRLPGYFCSHLGYGKIKIAKKKKKIARDWYIYDQYGICDLEGNIVLPMKYENIKSSDCESVAIEEHVHLKVGWTREGHLYNIKYDVMLLEGLVGEFRYYNPPIFFEKGWACHTGGGLRVYNPNTGEQVPVPVENNSISKTLERLGNFNDKNNQKQRELEILNSHPVHTYM